MNLLLDIRYLMLPEAILTLAILACCILSFLLQGNKQKIIYYVSTFSCILALISFNYISFIRESVGLWGSFVSDFYTVLFRSLILLGTLLTIQLSKKYISEFGSNTGEFYTLILTATLGAMLLTGSNDLVTIFIGLETLSISSYALCGYTKMDKLSNEAALKYLVIGAASTAILLYGFSFLYGITGQTNLYNIAEYMTSQKVNIIMLISFLFILGGFGFKLAAVPFHSWAPDVYQGSPVPVAAFLSVVSKTAAFAIIIRFINMVFGQVPIFSLTLATIAVLTMTIGNLMAINQSNIKRLMAYSSIAQAGYILVGLAIATNMGISSVIFYLITYLFMNFGVWAAIEMFVNETGRDSIDDFGGLAYQQPLLAIGFTICLLSLAGIPITAGFFSKFYLFQAVISAGTNYLWLLIIMLINTIIALYYYLRIIKSMFLKPQTVEIGQYAIIPSSKTLNAVLGFTVTIVILIGIFASPIISIAKFSATKINTPVAGVILK